MQDEEKENSGNGILIIGGLIIIGGIIAIMLKARQKQMAAASSIPSPALLTIQQMQQRIDQLEQQIKANALQIPLPIPIIEQRGGPDSEGVGFSLPTEGLSSSPPARNLIWHKDGSMTDDDTVGSTFSNNEELFVTRNADGFINYTKRVRNAHKVSDGI